MNITLTEEDWFFLKNLFKRGIFIAMSLPDNIIIKNRESQIAIYESLDKKLGDNFKNDRTT